jgi:hypothetical protein
MRSEKTKTLNLRVSGQFKQLLRQAAEAEHRSQTNLLEKLVHDYCAASGLASTMAPSTVPPSRSEP